MLHRMKGIKVANGLQVANQLAKIKLARLPQSNHESLKAENLPELQPEKGVMTEVGGETRHCWL